MLGIALFCGKFSYVFSSATFNSKTVLASDEDFKKASCIALQMWHMQEAQIWRVKWPFLLLNNVQTVRVQTLLSLTSCVQSPSLNLLLLAAAVGCNLQSVNKIWKQKLINNFSYCKNITLKWHYIDVVVVSSWCYFLLK